MKLEEIEELVESLDAEDVGQKRYLMNRIAEELLVTVYEVEDLNLPSIEERVKELQDFDGYMYKLLQDFLTSSSTLEKERKLEKMVEYVKRKSE